MITPKRTIVASKNLLKAYVAMKTGNRKKGARIFADLCNDENMDVIMDGIGKSIQDLEAQEEDMFEQEEDFGLDDEIEDEEENLGAQFDEETNIMDEEEEDEGIEIPQTVASVLRLKY